MEHETKIEAKGEFTDEDKSLLKKALSSKENQMAIENLIQYLDGLALLNLCNAKTWDDHNRAIGQRDTLATMKTVIELVIRKS